MIDELGPKEVVELVRAKGVRWLDLQFTDILGRLQHITTPSRDLLERAEEVFIKGFGKLDGSSIKGFKDIHESDLVLVPVPRTFALIPWARGTARMLCKVYDNYGKGRLEKDPRFVAERAEQHLLSNGYRAFFGSEVEFFIFDKVSVDVATPYSKQSYLIESREAPWSLDATSIRFKEGYYPVPPYDKTWLVRQEASEVLEDYFGFTVEAHHHEVSTAGQGEIDFRYGELTETADRIVTFKYVVKNVAAKHGMVATFMPKPLYADNGSGMHIHISLWDSNLDRNIFYDQADEYAELSQVGRYFIGGLLEHARSLAALVAPTTNSYKRLVPGYEAPVYIAWSRANRSACVRVPVYFREDSNGKRIEFRPPDPSCNPYLALAAITLAGLDGVLRKRDPGDPIDENIYLMSPKRRKELGIKSLPGSLEEALAELESDSEYLRQVFPKSLVDTYIELKRAECRAINMYPTPIEFRLYFDV